MTNGPGMAGATAEPVARARASARGGWFQRESVQGFVWIAPAFLYLAFFIAYPFFMSIYLSVSSARVGSPDSHFVGLQNYTRLFADPTFWQTVRNSFVFTIGSEADPAHHRAAAGLRPQPLVQGQAHRAGDHPDPVRDPDRALVARLEVDVRLALQRRQLDADARAHHRLPWQWLGEPGLAMWSVIILNVWRGFPFSAVILLAGLTAVPQEVIEAAKIDGAGPLRRFHYVMVPIVRPILLVGLLYSVVFSFTDFSAVWLLTQGGPYNTTHVFGTYAYNIGINAGDIGMGAAITLFIFPFLALIVILMLRFLRRD